MAVHAPWRISWVRSVNEIPADLWALCFPPPLEGRWWYGALEQARLEEQFEFFYGVIEDGSGPCGIAPVFLMDLPIDLVTPPLVSEVLRGVGRLIPRLRYKRTLFVGSPCADEGTVGLLKGISLSRFAPALEEALEELGRERRAALVVWKDFPAEARAALDGFAAEWGLFSFPSFPGTRMRLDCQDFAGYLKLLSRSQRQHLQCKLRRARAMGRLEVSAVQQPDAALLGEIFSLYGQTYAHAKTRFERLGPEFFSAVAQDDHAYYLLLRDPGTGRLVAFMLCFLSGPRVISKFMGHDYRYNGDWYIYFQLWRAAVEWALAMGAVEIQSGQTDYRAKLDLGLKPVPLYNYCKARHPLLHSVLARIAKRITWSTLDEDLKACAKAGEA